MATLIRSTNAWGFADLVRELGGDPDALFERFHLTPGVEFQEDAFISMEAFALTLEASAAELRCPDFGLRLARWQGLDMLGPLAVMARNASTLYEGLTLIGRYLHVHSPGLRLGEPEPIAGGLVRVSYEMVTQPRLDIPQGYELSLANTVRILTFLGGPDALPAAVYFTHHQMGSDEAYAAALGCPVHFSQDWCGFDVPLHLGARRIDRADPETHRIATRYLDAQFLPPQAPLSDRVAQLARRLLPTGHCTVDAIAAHLQMHPRTLQRHLVGEDVTCQEIIDRVRRDQAAKYLAEPTFLLSQIAGLLGYSEQSAFNRSCRRWFGRTPREYRAALL